MQLSTKDSSVCDFKGWQWETDRRSYSIPEETVPKPDSPCTDAVQPPARGKGGELWSLSRLGWLCLRDGWLQLVSWPPAAVLVSLPLCSYKYHTVMRDVDMLSTTPVKGAEDAGAQLRPF